jgi:hypothetical protein
MKYQIEVAVRNMETGKQGLAVRQIAISIERSCSYDDGFAALISEAEKRAAIARVISDAGSDVLVRMDNWYEPPPPEPPKPVARKKIAKKRKRK